VSPSPARSHDSARETAPLSAWSALDALDVGVLLLTPDLRVVFANARWAGWHGSDVLPGSAAATLIDEGDALHAMRAAYLDGEARAVSFTLCPAQADVSVRRLFGTVRRGASGLVV
jgi:hypothetical protein